MNSQQNAQFIKIKLKVLSPFPLKGIDWLFYESGGSFIPITGKHNRIINKLKKKKKKKNAK